MTDAVLVIGVFAQWLLALPFIARLITGALLPTGMAVVRVQLKVVVPEQVQPLPLPVMVLMPLGRTSVTVTVPLVGTLPLLVTVKVQARLLPAATEAGQLLTIVKIGAQPVRLDTAVSSLLADENSP